MSDQVALGPGREFDLIRELQRRWGERASGLGDDAAVVTAPSGESLVVSCDSSVEGVHFRRDWLRPAEIGYRATAAALSDLAAMAAEPLGLLVALVLPELWLTDFGPLADGIGEAAAAAGTRIIGGDVVRGRELTISATVLGRAAAPLRRGGASPGDGIFVTGRLGGPLSALRAWQQRREPDPAARARFARPVPRLREARWLAARGARACVDISDGLLGDLSHLAHASRLRLDIELDRIPVFGDLSPTDAARSGEEYEVAVAAPGEFDCTGFAREFGIPLTRIGAARVGPPGIDATLHGERVADAWGYDHFS